MAYAEEVPDEYDDGVKIEAVDNAQMASEELLSFINDAGIEVESSDTISLVSTNVANPVARSTESVRVLQINQIRGTTVNQCIITSYAALESGSGLECVDVPFIPSHKRTTNSIEFTSGKGTISISGVISYDIVNLDLFSGVYVRPLSTSTIYSYTGSVVTVNYINSQYSTTGYLCDSNYNKLTDDNYNYSIYNYVTNPVALQSYSKYSPLASNRNIYFITNHIQKKGMNLIFEVKANGYTNSYAFTLPSN